MAAWIEIAREVYAEVDRKKLPLVAAGVAFFGLLALFPGIGAMMALAGIFADPGEVADMLGTLDDILPAAAAQIISAQAQEVAGTSRDGLGVVAAFGLVVTIYSASKGMQALIDGLNIIHERRDTRGFVRQTALKLMLTAGMILGVLLCIAVAVVVPVMLGWIPLAGDTEWLITLARWPILLAIAAAGIAMTYRHGPVGERAPWRWIVPGAAMACLLWLVGTAAFAVYVRMFGSYQETFGALGGVVILLMWLWVSASIVLLGALVSHVLRRRAG